MIARFNGIKTPLSLTIKRGTLPNTWQSLVAEHEKGLISKWRMTSQPLLTLITN